LGGPALNDGIRRFLDEDIDGLEPLEVLLSLERASNRAFTPTEVADRVGISAANAERRLEDLHRRQLLVREQGAYRYAPASTRKAGVIAELAKVYQEERLAVIHLVSERALKRLRSFAAAFRLRQEGRDD